MGTEYVHNLFSLRDYFSMPYHNDSGDHFTKSNIKMFCYALNKTAPCVNVRISENLNSAILEDTNPLIYIAMKQWFDMKVNAVFIPATEMLSHSRGFLALYRERSLPYDITEINIISKAELGPTREITPNASKVIEKITAIIGGQVEFDGQDFFIMNPNKKGKIIFPFEASGFRKLGLLYRLLRNGLLENGTVLFWDEPENSLNPEHYTVLIDILLELSRNGVQIFLATHNEVFASYVAVNRKMKDQIKFHSFYKNGNGIAVNTSDRFDLLEPNSLNDAVAKLYEKEVITGLSNG